jgi:hypothetical protein
MFGKKAIPIGWLSYNLHVLGHLKETQNGHPGYEMELWIELANQAMKANVTGRCKRDVEVFLTKELLAQRALAHLSRLPEFAALEIAGAQQPAAQHAPSASSLVDVCARTIHDISLLHCKGRWHFASAAAGDAAVSAAFGCWLRAEPGMAAADPAAASVNAFSSAYVRGHTYHALAYTRKSTSKSEAVSWQADMLQDDGACSTVAVQTFLHVTHPDAPGLVFRAALVFQYKEHELVGADKATLDAAEEGGELARGLGYWLKAGLRVVWALPFTRSAAGEPQPAGATHSDCTMAVVSASRLVRRRLVPRVKEAAWMPVQWCNCHPVLP